MTELILGLTLAYVAVAALLLNLNLATKQLFNNGHRQFDEMFFNFFVKLIERTRQCVEKLVKTYRTFFYLVFTCLLSFLQACLIGLVIGGFLKFLQSSGG